MVEENWLTKQLNNAKKDVEQMSNWSKRLMFGEGNYVRSMEIKEEKYLQLQKKIEKLSTYCSEEYLDNLFKEIKKDFDNLKKW